MMSIVGRDVVTHDSLEHNKYGWFLVCLLVCFRGNSVLTERIGETS